MTPIEKLRRIVADAKGDALERFEADPEYEWLSEILGDREWLSGIHEKYRIERAEWRAASDLLERLIAGHEADGRGQAEAAMRVERDYIEGS